MKFAFLQPLLAMAASGVVFAAPQATSLLARIPLHFEPHGSTFVARAPGYTVQMGQQGAAIGLSHSRLLLHLKAADLSRLEGVSQQASVSHYLRGRDSRQWRTAVPHYARVRYRQAYPGIDVEFYGNARQIEYDFVLQPGADPSLLRMDIAEARLLQLQGGDLRMETTSGEAMLLRAPIAYQTIDGQRIGIQSRFVLQGNTVSFHLGRYDARHALTIDPVLTFATYYGGATSDVPTAIALDASGNTYIAGYTNSTNLPLAGESYGKILNGDEDIFVAKLNPSGNQLLYSTYIGGSAGERPVGIVVNAVGQVTIAGNTSSLNFPHNGLSVPSTGIGLFLSKLAADGSQIVASMMIAYAELETLGVATALAADPAGNLYLAGHTGNPGFPATNGVYQQSLRGETDAFVAKIAPNLNELLYATFLGGAAPDQALAVTADAQGNAYLTGQTQSGAFPFTPGAYLSPNRAGWDVFVSRLSSDGKALNYSAILGGSADDYGRAISIGPGNSIYLAGLTLSSNYVTTAGAYQSLRPSASPNAAFITRLSPTMDVVQYSTYFGSPSVYFNVESVSRILVDGAGNFVLGGHGLGNGLPITPGAIQSPSPGGLNDVFLAQFNPGGDLLSFSTYLGGAGSDTLAGMAMDSAGNLYLAGSTSSTNFPATAGAFRTVNSGGIDGYVAKIDFGGATANCAATLVASSYTAGAEGAESTFDFTINSGCAWNVSSNQTWVTVTSAASGTGSATVTFRIDINTTTSNRTAAIAVAGKTFAITQTGTPCSLQVTPGNRTVPATGGAMTFTVNGLAGCAWTTTTVTPWLQLQGSGAGNGPGLVAVTFDTNSGAAPRSGLITVAKQGVYVLQPAASPQSAFLDVPVNFLFNDHIYLMKQANVADFCNGDPNQFCAESPTTRATMALYIIRALYGGDSFTYRTQPYFTDVPSTHPQFPHIQKMRELGYTAGCTATTYCPNDSVTRGQMAAFIVRTKMQRRFDQTITFPTIPYFTDVPPTDSFFGYIQKMKELGVTSGCTESTYCQWDTNTRGQMAVFVVRALLTP
ncbi:MAG: SBBP repeat-containing protein [Bryobacterales bacterium]|nr:SBBP repeat-containing protein [Bryobacterales bacterium]